MHCNITRAILAPITSFTSESLPNCADDSICCSAPFLSVRSNQTQPLMRNRRGGYTLPDMAGETQSTGRYTGLLWRPGQCNCCPDCPGLNLAHKKQEFSIFCAWNGCQTIITLLGGINVTIWRHVIGRLDQPFKDNQGLFGIQLIASLCSLFKLYLYWNRDLQLVKHTLKPPQPPIF